MLNFCSPNSILLFLEKNINTFLHISSKEYILRALNSLQSPEEKLAALCKKYADLHEEHRLLQTSFKTQQRTMAVVRFILISNPLKYLLIALNLREYEIS